MSSAAVPSAFFPPLSSLLSGTSRLISLQDTHDTFTVSTSFAADNESLEKFCYDAQTFSLLSSSPDGLPQPSAKSRSDFEAETAPIQVNGSQNGEYDLEQMKRDALELSAQLGVEESFALRIVVLEWQSRAEEQLLRAGDDRSRAGGLDASSFGKSLTGFSVSVNGFTKSANDFSDEKTRRRRQLDIYLRERSSRLRLSVDLLSHQATREKPGATATWMDDLARQLFNDRFKLNTVSPTLELVFEKCMQTFDEQLKILDDPSRAPKMVQENEETMLMFATASLGDIVTIMRLLLTALHVRNDSPTPAMVTAWFQKLESISYFLDLAPSPALPDTTELQCLVSLISFTILDVSGTIAHLRKNVQSQSTEGVSYPRLDTGKYIEDQGCVRELNMILYRAAMNNVSILSPANFAWALIATLIQNVAAMHSTMRDRLLEDGSSDNELSGGRRHSRRDSRQDLSLFERLYGALHSAEMEPEMSENPSEYLAVAALESVFGVLTQISKNVSSIYTSATEMPTQRIARTQTLQLMQEGVAVTAYGGEMLEAILAAIKPRTPGISKETDMTNAQLAGHFFASETFRREVLNEAVVRYPYELSPLLRLLASLASGPDTWRDIVQLLEGLQTVTVQVPENFNAYQLVNEDEDENEIQVLETLPLFISRQALSWHGPSHIARKTLTMGTREDSERGMNVRSLPAGSLGFVVKEDRPMVFKLEHAHSGLEYLGQLLSTRLPNSEMVLALGQPPLELEAAADIVSLVNALLSASLQGPHGAQEAKLVLQRMSFALPDETDVINVLAESFESELVAHLDQAAQNGSLELLIACTEFFALLVKVDSGRVWSAFAHSSLLGLNGGTNALATVVGGTETVLGHFRFLSACTTVHTNLVDDAISGLVQRIPVEQPAKRGRFDSPMERGEYTPERTMQKVLEAYTAVMLEAWESMGEWRFAAPAEKAAITSNICSGFQKLLRSTYGLRDDVVVSGNTEEKARQQERRLAGLLFSAADTVLEFFGPVSGGATSALGFAHAVRSAAAVLEMRPSVQDRLAQVQQIQDISGLHTILLRCLRSEDQASKRALSLATQLLKSIPDIAIIFALEPTLKGTISGLLAEITNTLSAAADQNDPPSLLGQLTASPAKAFLTVLTQMARPLCDVRTEEQLWSFFNAVMKGRQQWLALYLLTGSVPKDRLNASSAQTANGAGKSLLAYALNELSDLEKVSPGRGSALLSFVSAAQAGWIWASNEVQKHPNFLRSVVDWLGAMKHQEKFGGTQDQLKRAHETLMAGHMCEVLAQVIHISAEVGNQSTLSMFGNKLDFLSTHGMKVDAYNRSLHLNLTDNFRSRFAGVKLEAFKRSIANPAEEYGKEWTYDVQLMGHVVGYEKAWLGSSNPRGQTNGFREEVSRANVNLSLVSAQSSLLRSWNALATTLAECVGTGDEAVRSKLSQHLAQTAQGCLKANAEANIDIPGTDKLLMMRAEMTFVILTKLAQTPSTPELRAVLSSAWRALKASPVDFDIATREDDLQYYRLGLQILFLAIQPHIRAGSRNVTSSFWVNKEGVKATDETPITFLDPAVAGVLMNVATKTIAPAWRALAGNLHTDVACALPGDFAVVTALLQAILAVPGIGVVHTQIAEVVAATQLIRSALSLYSWADRLAEAMDGDPVYGELAVQFLQVLSTVRPVAEHIALEGALMQLASANLSSYFRKPGGKGPFDEPRRMFTIWTEGMLPVCLNLLDAVGPPVAAEVSGFLNGFPLQLQRANCSLENREPTKHNLHAGAVTLGLVQEAHSLCLICMILQSDTARAAAEGVDAMGIGGLHGYDHKKVVEDVAGLVRQKTSLASRIVPANAMELEWAGRTVDGVDSWLKGKIVEEIKGLASMDGDGEDD